MEKGTDDPASGRIEKFERLFSKKKRNRNQLCWIKFNPEATFSYDIVNAEEDVQWMIYEMKRLKKENKELHEFIDTMRVQLEQELATYK